MGIYLNHLFSNRFPLHFVSEQVMMVPQQRDLPISSVGWPKILYFFSGTATMELDGGVAYHLEPGDTVILSGRHGQRYLAGASPVHTRVHALIISFERPLEGGSLSAKWDAEAAHYLKETFTENIHLPTRGAARLWGEAVRLRNACNAPPSIRGELVRELAYSFMLRVAEHAGICPGVALPRHFELAGKAGDAAMTAVVEGGKAAGRLGAARKLGVSVATLDRACRMSLGMPYARYLDWISVERAKLLLLDSTLPISGVARALRYTSPGQFSRAFKAATGLTPGGYQQSFSDVAVNYSRSLLKKRVAAGAGAGLPEPKGWRVLDTPVCLKTKTASLLFALEGESDVSVGDVAWSLREDEFTALFLPAGSALHGVPGKKGARLAIVEAHSSGSLAKGETLGLAASGQRVAAMGLPLLRAWLREAAFSSHARLSVRSLIGSLWWGALGEFAALLKNADDCSSTSHGAVPASGKAPMEHNHQLLISNTKEFILKHLSRDLSLGKIAWAAGVSEEHLARVFRAGCGETVMEYRMRRRVIAAQRALVRTRKPIVEIAEAAGFGSVAHFHRVFKQQTGCTPGEFRTRGEGALP